MEAASGPLFVSCHWLHGVCGAGTRVFSWAPLHSIAASGNRIQALWWINRVPQQIAPAMPNTRNDGSNRSGVICAPDGAFGCRQLPFPQSSLLKLGYDRNWRCLVSIVGRELRLKGVIPVRNCLSIDAYHR